MQIQIFTVCSRFEMNPLYGPLAIGISAAIKQPVDLDKTVITVLLGFTFDESDWQARKVQLRVFNDAEEVVNTTDPETWRPGDQYDKYEVHFRFWELAGDHFEVPGDYWAALYVDDEPARRVVLRARFYTANPRFGYPGAEDV